jgi:hypothetical protein
MDPFKDNFKSKDLIINLNYFISFLFLLTFLIIISHLS